jgi:hypothetical protein
MDLTVALYYLTEVVWPAGDDMIGRPLEFRLVAQCATLADCDRQAETRAKSHGESGFDAERDAWWGKDGERIHYYHRTTDRPGRFWKGLKPKLLKPKGLEPTTKSESQGSSAKPEPTPAARGEEPGQGPDDKPEDREREELPPIPGT